MRKWHYYEANRCTDNDVMHVMQCNAMQCDTIICKECSGYRNAKWQNETSVFNYFFEAYFAFECSSFFGSVGFRTFLSTQNLRMNVIAECHKHLQIQNTQNINKTLIFHFIIFQCFQRVALFGLDSKWFRPKHTQATYDFRFLFSWDISPHMQRTYSFLHLNSLFDS